MRYLWESGELSLMYGGQQRGGRRPVAGRLLFPECKGFGR